MTNMKCVVLHSCQPNDRLRMKSITPKTASGWALTGTSERG